ncbi:MAG TPA: hypothetical protein PKE35_10340 [Anaerolineales bacterium]|nr:hypothetical protein [Anaerolineales bacterium]HMX74645.1 hypothetical protein [Anaerolineales bacterium]HND92826.1 hypothetical protein [Anaerolineales bacterium]HNE68597.1 hypothetical protein [Anaerolineales bacterium]
MTDRAEDSLKNDVLYTDDLALNRNGQLSETQKKRLWPGALFWLMLAGINVIFLLLLSFFQLRYQTVGCGYLGLFVIAIFSIRQCILNSVPYREDIKNGIVKTASGQAFKRAVLQSFSKGVYLGNCSVRVNNKVFTISPHFYNWMVDEGYYRIYFTPKTKRVVNIEEL